MKSEPARNGSIRLATADDLTLLPEIELAAARLFLDYAEVLGLDEDLLQSTRSLEELRQAQVKGLLWVAVDALDRPVGFALAVELEGRLHLEEMDVDPSRGRCGLGTALVQAVCAAARERGQSVTLSTFRDVPFNAPFYAKMGFRQLKDSELTPGLRRLREEEALRGLNLHLRILMLLD